MGRADSNTPLVFAGFVLSICVLAAVLVSPASAYLFGPGKYCGVVVFDRWGTCYLLSGPYINYVASNVKSPLARYKGQAIQIDASKVGYAGREDPLILKYKILGSAPEPKGITIAGLKLAAIPAFGRYIRPQFLIEIRNAGKSPVKVERDLLGIFLFDDKAEESRPGDDSSALISRTGIEDASRISTVQIGDRKTSWGYIVDMATRPPAKFAIEPGQSVRTRIRFKISSGKYQFIFAYGDRSGKTLVSNAIAFDIGSDGRAIKAQ